MILTVPQYHAMQIAKRDGIVVAGIGSHDGRVERVNPRTIDALVKRGLLQRAHGPDGQMAGRIKQMEAQS
jgi:hypothetical protein